LPQNVINIEIGCHFWISSKVLQGSEWLDAPCFGSAQHFRTGLLSLALAIGINW